MVACPRQPQRSWPNRALGLQLLVIPEAAEQRAPEARSVARRVLEHGCPHDPRPGEREVLGDRACGQEGHLLGSQHLDVFDELEALLVVELPQHGLYLSDYIRE